MDELDGLATIQIKLSYETVKWLLELDCGDNSCLFFDRSKGGMRTNGGCRCLKALPFPTRIIAQQILVKVSKELRGQSSSST